MQVLKDEITSSILRHAEDLFYRHGYAGASMRELAQQVGVSFSNLYRYYKNKADLYEALMQPYYTAFMETVRGSLEHEENEPAGGEHARLVIGMFMRLIQTDRQKFVILLEGSQGTAFESVREEMVAAIQARMRLSLPGKAGEEALLMRILAENLLRAVLEITRETREGTTLRRRLENLFAYHLGGVQKLAAG